MKRLNVIALISLTVLLSTCSKDDPKENPKTTVEFPVNQLIVTERSTERVELTFSKDTEPTDSFIITLTTGDADETDFELSETLVDHEFIISALEPHFDLTAVFDALPETDETIELEITSVADGYEVGEKSTLTIVLKNYNIGNNLVGEYLFNGNAEDSSPENVNHGTVFGTSLTTDRAGNANQAYAFDGVDDYISIPDNDATDFSLDGDYTVSLWIDAAAIQTDVSSTNNFILRKWDGILETPYPFGFSLLNQTHPANPNEFFFETYEGSVCGNAKNLYSGVINYNEFKHYVIVKSGNKLIQYLNGVKVSEVTHTLTCATSNTVPITIGTSVHLIRFFKGKIDDIRFYNVALDQIRVTELYEEEPVN